MMTAQELLDTIKPGVNYLCAATKERTEII